MLLQKFAENILIFPVKDDVLELSHTDCGSWVSVITSLRNLG